MTRGELNTRKLSVFFCFASEGGLGLSHFEATSVFGGFLATRSASRRDLLIISTMHSWLSSLPNRMEKKPFMGCHVWPVRCFMVRAAGPSREAPRVPIRPRVSIVGRGRGKADWLKPHICPHREMKMRPPCVMICA